MKLGFVSAILPEVPLADVIAFAGQTGYECVELMCWPPGRADRRYAGVTHVDVTRLSPADAADIRGLCDRHRVAICGLGYYPNVLSPDADEAARCTAHLGQVIRGAALLGLSNVNTFVGRNWKLSVEENWPRFLETWRPLVALAEEHGVRIGIENCPMLFTADEWPGGKNLAGSPAIWRRMFADIPSPCFGLNYDPSHLVWQQMDESRPLREFASRIFHGRLPDRDDGGHRSRAARRHAGGDGAGLHEAPARLRRADAEGVAREGTDGDPLATDGGRLRHGAGGESPGPPAEHPRVPRRGLPGDPLLHRPDPHGPSLTTAVGNEPRPPRRLPPEVSGSFFRHQPGRRRPRARYRSLSCTHRHCPACRTVRCAQ